MTTIYILTSGEYSDYRIVGAFSTEEKANAAIEFFGYEEHDCQVEEFEIDASPDSPFAPPPGMNAWRVFISNGNTTANRTPNDSELKSYFNVQQPTIHSSFVCTCHATDSEHAAKIASEKRAQMLAEAPPPFAPPGRVPYDSRSSIIDI